MKHICCVKLLTILLFSSLLISKEIPKSAIVYYGNDISWPMVGLHDYIILDPNHLDTYAPGFSSYRDKVYIYMSVTEAEKGKSHFKDISPKWILGKNRAWNSIVLDMSNPKYREFLLKRVVEPLHKRGFKNLFLDTMDSYYLILKDKQKIKAQQDGIVAFLKELHKRYPKMKVILNRGFDIFPRVKDLGIVDAVLFESYYYGLDAKLGYKEVSAKDREYLDSKLKAIEDSNTTIIAVDYLKNPHSKLAKELVKKLKERGFIPYISDKSLYRYGLSSKNPIKREILVLYDGTRYPQPYQGAHQQGALPIEYMGYIPILKDLRLALPKHPEDRYAGVILWEEAFLPNPKKIYNWIAQQSKKGLKTLIVSTFGYKKSPKVLNILGIKTSTKKSSKKRVITIKSPILGFETPPIIQNHETLYTPPKGSKPLLKYRVGKQDSTLASYTPWGGYAINEAFMSTFGEDNLWVINPFKFFKEGLKLDDIPALDPTTENGRRILFSHLDGDAIMNRVEWNPKLVSGDIIYEEVLKKYHFPQSISIVGAEVMPDGLYPKLSPRLMDISRKIFALPYIEPTSHTFSHPFIWAKIKNGNLSPKYRLNPPGYKFSLYRELPGFLKEIKRLSPPDKPSSRLIQWSGDCVPPENILKYAYHHNLLNINGGDTTITKAHPWLSNIAPFGIKKGPFYQVYTAQQDENVYTNNFTSKFWGYRNVIQTFDLTNEPRRFKAVDIYYHYYSGSKIAALKALKYVFDWAMKQPLFPIYTTEYIPKVLEFYTASIAKIDGNWVFYGLNSLRDVRLSNAFDKVDILNSKGVIGYKQEDSKRRFVSLDGSRVKILHLSKKPKEPNSFLISANGRLISKEKDSYKFNSYVPLVVELRVKKGCRVISEPEANITQKESIVTIDFKSKKAKINVLCK